jgi:hypothetical protein
MTPEGWTVAAWAAVVVFLVIAGIAFFGAFRAGAPDAASHLRRIGFASSGIAAAILIVKRLIANFLDS